MADPNSVANYGIKSCQCNLCVAERSVPEATRLEGELLWTKFLRLPSIGGPEDLGADVRSTADGVDLLKKMEKTFPLDNSGGTGAHPWLWTIHRELSRRNWVMSKNAILRKEGAEAIRRFQETATCYEHLACYLCAEKKDKATLRSGRGKDESSA